MPRRSPPLIALALLLAACGGGNAASSPSSPPPVQLAPLVASAPSSPIAAAEPMPNEDDAAVPISPRNPTWGSRTAPATIVEFADFQDPYSARVQKTLAELEDKYGPEKLRIVWKNNPLPFHTNAKAAAIAAMGVLDLAGRDAFWKFHHSLYANQGTLDAEHFESWAAEAGVTDLAAFREGLASSRWVDPVEADLRDGKSLSVQGTPSFFVNGVFINGAQPIENFTKVIDAEVDKARARIAAATPASRVYAEMARLNRAEAPKPLGNENLEKDDTTTVFKMQLGTSPTRGKPTALVTIIEFGDFQCPYTKKVEATLSALRTRYGDKVRLVWKNEPLPFHPMAEPAAQAALEVRTQAGDAAFWSIHDKLLASLQTGLSIDAIAGFAAQAGAGEAKVRAAMSSHTHKRELEGDGDLAEDFAVAGTPHFFINGRRLVGAQPEERFAKIIDEELAKAEALVAKGTPPAGLYVALTKDGKGPLPLEVKDVPTSLPASDPVRGNPGAKVVLHEWADFQCPFCGRAEVTLAQVMKDYGARIKFVWHDLPLPMHPDAPLAAQAARETLKQKGAAAFWAMHEKLLGNQQHLKRDDLDGYARGLGLDMGAWAAALDGGTHAGEVEADKNAAGSASIVGTPSFLIVAGASPHGYFINGAQAYGKFRKLIERALAEAK